jgi:hypothetical protein
MATEEVHPQARTTVSVSFREGVETDDLHRTLDFVIGGIINRTGCVRCGLVGIDLILHGGDPVEQALREVVREVDAVQGVSVAQGRATTI